MSNACVQSNKVRALLTLTSRPDGAPKASPWRIQEPKDGVQDGQPGGRELSRCCAGPKSSRYVTRRAGLTTRADDYSDHPGAYIDDCQIKETPQHARDDAAARKLWSMAQSWAEAA